MITTHSRFHTSFRNNLNKLYNLYICDREYNNYEIQDGYRYNWYAVNDNRSIIPFEWSVPTSTVLVNIAEAIAPTNSIINANMLGMRLDDGTFSDMTDKMRCWSSNALNADDGIYVEFGIPNGYTFNSFSKRYGLPVRLVKSNTSLDEGETGTMTGNDGKIYPTICIKLADDSLIEIMTENLCETKFRNGEIIPEVTSDNEWSELEEAGRCAWDNDETNAITIGGNESTPYVAGRDGFTLTYESDDVLCPSIISSRCEIHININDDIRDEWDTFVQDLLLSDDETRFFVYITENAEPYWVGPIQIERLQIPDEYYTRVKLTATDGFGLLGSIPYSNGSTLYTGWDTIVQHVTNILSKLHMHDEMPWTFIAHSSKWNAKEVLTTEFANPFRFIRFQHDAMKEFKGDLTVPFDCLTVLKQILQRFNLRLVQQNTVYFFQNYRTLSETSAVKVDYFDNTGTYLETDEIPLNYSTVQKLRGGMSFYREQAKYASVQYSYKDAIQGSNMFGIFPVQENTPFDLGIIPAGNGETVGFAFDFRIIIPNSVATPFTYYIEFIFTIQSGTYYLSNETGIMVWTDGDNTKRVRLLSMFPFNSSVFVNVIEQIGFITSEAPFTDTMTFTWTWRQLDAILMTELTPPTGSAVVISRNESSIIYAVGDPNEGTKITTAQGANTSGEIVAPDVLILGDLPYLRSVGRLQFYGTTGDYLNTFDQWDYNNVGTFNIDELLAQELAAFQRVPTKVLSLKLLSDVYFAYKLDGHILLRGTYNANANIWSVECYLPTVDVSDLTYSEYVESDNLGGISGNLITPPTPIVGEGSNWKRTGTTLSPKTAGDKVQVEVTGFEKIAIEGIVDDGDSYGVKGSNDSGSGVLGTGKYGVHGYTDQSDGYAGQFNTTSGGGIVINTADGIGIFNGISPTDNAIEIIRKVYRIKTGLSNAVVGAKDQFVFQSLGDSDVSAEVRYFLSNAANGSETSAITWWLRNAGAALAEVMRLTGAGQLQMKEARIGDATDNTTFAADGTLTMNGKATVWEDLRIAANDLSPGGSNDPSGAVWLGNLRTVAFSASQMNELFFECQIPHSYKEGTDIYPHIHWRPLSSAATATRVRWGLEYVWQNMGADAPVSTTTIYTATVTPNENLVGYKHYVSAFSAISGTGKTISSMLSCRVFRDATNAADDFTGEAGLMEIDFHFESDTLGSQTETSKT